MGKNTETASPTVENSKSKSTPKAKRKTSDSKLKSTSKRKSSGANPINKTPKQANSIRKYLKTEVLQDGIIGMKVRSPTTEKAS